MFDAANMLDTSKLREFKRSYRRRIDAIIDTELQDSDQEKEFDRITNAGYTDFDGTSEDYWELNTIYNSQMEPEPRAITYLYDARERFLRDFYNYYVMRWCTWQSGGGNFPSLYMDDRTKLDNRNVICMNEMLEFFEHIANDTIAWHEILDNSGYYELDQGVKNRVFGAVCNASYVKEQIENILK